MSFREAVRANTSSCRIGIKGFLLFRSQNGVAIQQVIEDWFDLTQPDFKPLFSFTSDGSEWRFAFGVGRRWHAKYKVYETAEAEVIDLTLDVHFDGIGLDQKAVYLGV